MQQSADAGILNPTSCRYLGFALLLLLLHELRMETEVSLGHERKVKIPYQLLKLIVFESSLTIEI